MLAGYRRGQPVIKAAGSPLSPAVPAGVELSPLSLKMAAGALRLWLVLALQLRRAAPLAVPRDAPGAAERAESGEPDALLHLRDLPRGPAVAAHRKAPQFMLDLFNAVTVSDGTSKSQKEILEGNIVRSFEDKGEQNPGSPRPSFMQEMPLF